MAERGAVDPAVAGADREEAGPEVAAVLEDAAVQQPAAAPVAARGISAAEKAAQQEE